MNHRTTIVLAIAGAALAGCAANSAQQTASMGTQCAALGDTSERVASLYENGITAVKPLHKKEFIARAIQPKYIAGAELYVTAEEGMNQAYLDRVLSCHAGASTLAAHPSDPLRVTGIERVDVSAAGGHYRIAITGRDRAAGKRIWQTAQQLDPGAGTVQVQQLAAGAGNGEL